MKILKNLFIKNKERLNLSKGLIIIIAFVQYIARYDMVTKDRIILNLNYTNYISHDNFLLPTSKTELVDQQKL